MKPAPPVEEPRVQYAALPWRKRPGGVLEVLLITSRETRRWLIPKGWPIRGLGPHLAAAQEAFEEAGVAGVASRKAIGEYHYDKRLRSGRMRHVRVRVFAMKVTHERSTWPEMAERDREWVAREEAAARVAEPELAALLAGFAPR